MEDIKNYLVEKGWGKKDINKTIKIIKKAKKNKHPKIKILDKLIYWISLAVAIGGNFIITIALIPELIALKGFQLYLVIITLGISFGLLFELLIRKIEKLKTKHHVFLGTIIPILAVVNFIIILNNMKKLIGIESSQDSIIVGAVYSIFFILPYIFHQTFLKDKY